MGGPILRGLLLVVFEHVEPLHVLIPFFERDSGSTSHLPIRLPPRPYDPLVKGGIRVLLNFGHHWTSIGLFVVLDLG